MSFVWGLLVLISMSSCANKPSDTDVLKKYFKDTFNGSLVKTDHYYLVIPKYGCSGCMKQITKQLVDSLQEERDKITWILSNRDKSFSQLLGQYNWLNDKESGIERCLPSIAGITVIFVSEGQIRYVNNIYTKNDADQFIQKIKLSVTHPNPVIPAH